MTSKTRRGFVRSNLALAAGLAGAGGATASQGRAIQNPADSIPDSDIKVPKIRFGDVEISRLILGCNMLGGAAHYNRILGGLMREWYTEERVVEVMQRANQHGINAFNYYPGFPRSLSDFKKFQAGGGKMHVIAQGTIEPAELVRTVQPLAIYHQGERVDRAYRDRRMDTVQEYCKKVRDLGVMVGVGTHRPEVIEFVEDKGWDVDFYAGCVYDRNRSPEELRKLLGGELPEMAREVYLQDDPARMYKVMRKTPKPCLAFKILAAGRVVSVENAFKQAFESLKPIDAVMVGVFPRFTDEVKENAWWTTCYGKRCHLRTPGRNIAGSASYPSGGPRIICGPAGRNLARRSGGAQRQSPGFLRHPQSLEC